MFINILIVLIVWIAVVRWQRRRKIWCCAQFKNEMNTLPLIGAHSTILFGNGEAKANFFKALGREGLRQGGITSLYAWIADQFHIVIADPAVAELVLKTQLEKDDSMKVFGKIFPESLPVEPVSKWRPRRKALNPAFALKHLNQYTNVFRKNSQKLVEKLREVGNYPFSVYNCLATHNFDIISETTLNIKSDEQIELKKTTLEAVKRSFTLISERMTQPLYYNDFIYEMTSQYRQLKSVTDVMYNFVYKNAIQNLYKFQTYITADTSMEDDSTENKPRPLQELLIEASRGEVTDDILASEALIVLFAGTDTSAVVTSFTCLMLAKYSDIQERAYQEIRDIIGDSQRQIENEDLSKLKYLESVIKETMRLYPPGLLLLRKIDTDLVLPSGQTLVRGTGAMINVWALHRHPRYWGEDADVFRPERFLEGTHHPGAFLPFSYGPRNCVGYQYAMMSMKTTLATLLMSFVLRPAKEDQQDIRTTFDILSRDVDNFALKVVPRTC